MTLKSNTLKLSPLLTQYLYTHHELNLTGIGRFKMNIQDVYTEPVTGSAKPLLHAEIFFEQDSYVKEDDKLVAFISAQSGKMKSLAASDLDSFLELSKQFLNIGKPFSIDGIGILTKNKSGNLDFAAEGLLHEKMKENSSVTVDQTATSEDSFTNYEEMLSPKKQKTPQSKRLVLWLSIFTGIGLAGWGGYIVYTKTKKTGTPETSNTVIIQPKDTTIVLKPDSSLIISKDTLLTDLPGTYKFIIEKSDRGRALTRFADLKKWGINVQMETKDSISFKLFFALPALASDTTRIKDSLSLLYGSRGKATIDQ